MIQHQTITCLRLFWQILHQHEVRRTDNGNHLVGQLLSAGAVSVPCPSGTVGFNVNSTTDVQTFTDQLNCTGEGVFHITWFANLTLHRTIEFSNMKDVTITGSGFPVIRGGLGYYNAGRAVGSDRAFGMFALSNGSTLRLNNVVLEEGNADNGGAVVLLANSSLFSYGCTFTGNSAANGGESTFFTLAWTKSKKTNNIISNSNIEGMRLVVGLAHILVWDIEYTGSEQRPT